MQPGKRGFVTVSFTILGAGSGAAAFFSFLQPIGISSRIENKIMKLRFIILTPYHKVATSINLKLLFIPWLTLNNLFHHKQYGKRTQKSEKNKKPI